MPTYGGVPHRGLHNRMLLGKLEISSKVQASGQNVWRIKEAELLGRGGKVGLAAERLNGESCF